MGKLFERLFESKRPEQEFLPAILEIQSSPPSPVGRATLWSIMIFLGFALIWSIVGKVEIIAVAPGKIVPNDRVKTIQPLENAVVSEIHVKDGDHVKAGDVLVVLDTRQTQSDVNNLSSQLEDKEARLIALTALDALLVDQKGLTAKLLAFPSTISKSAQMRQQSLYEEQAADFLSASMMAEHAVKKQQEDLATSNSELHKLEETLPIITTKASAFKRLFDKHMASQMFRSLTNC